MAEPRKRTPRTPTAAPRAIGDDAVAAGMRLVAGGEMANTMETIENETRDYIAQRAKRTSPTIDIWVQPTAPTHVAGRVWIRTT